MSHDIDFQRNIFALKIENRLVSIITDKQPQAAQVSDDNIT